MNARNGDQRECPLSDSSSMSDVAEFFNVCILPFLCSDEAKYIPPIIQLVVGCWLLFDALNACHDERSGDE